VQIDKINEGDVEDSRQGLSLVSLKEPPDRKRRSDSINVCTGCSGVAPWKISLLLPN
jgi:hypothetical protein